MVQKWTCTRTQSLKVTIKLNLMYYCITLYLHQNYYLVNIDISVTNDELFPNRDKKRSSESNIMGVRPIATTPTTPVGREVEDSKR